MESFMEEQSNAHIGLKMDNQMVVVHKKQDGRNPLSVFNVRSLQTVEMVLA